MSRLPADPLWTRAPLLLWSHLGAGAAVVAAVFVLVVASASAPLFLSSAAEAAFARERDALYGAVPGLRAYATGAGADPDAYAQLDEVFSARVRELGGLSEPVRSLTLVDDALGRPAEARLASAEGDAPAVLFWREGAVDAVEPIEPAARGEGVWVPEALASKLDLAAGAMASYVVERTVGSTNAGTPVRLEMRFRVAGVYADPFADDRAASADREYWRRARPFLPTQRQSTAVAPLLLADRETVLAARAQLDTLAAAGWESALIDSALSLAEARPLAAGLDRLTEQAADSGSDLGRAAQAFTRFDSAMSIGTILPATVAGADATAAALVPPLQALSAAGQFVALGMTAAAAALLVRRRRSEIRLLAVQGVSPVVLALRAPLEVLPAVVIGAAAGWFASTALVALTGPSSLIAPDRRGQAVSFTVAAALAALVVVAISTGLAARGALEPTSGSFRALGRRVPWDAVALALAGAGVYQVLLRSAARDAEGEVDLLVALFPLLAVAGLVAVMARAVARWLPRLGRLPAGRLPIPVWLAARRLGTAGSAALLLLTGAATALGVLLYALTLAASTGPAIRAKVSALSGSAATAEVFLPEASAGRLPDPQMLPSGTTVVWRADARAQPGGVAVSVLAVDPRSFAAAASWHDRFASEPLPALLAKLSTPTPQLPVLATGRPSSGASAPLRGLLEASGVTVPYEAVAAPVAFPGMGERRTVLVVDARQLFPRLLDDPARAPSPEEPVFAPEVFRPEVWSGRGEAELMIALEALGLGGVADLFEIRTADDVAARPALLAQSWTLNYLVALGLAGGILAVAGLLLHLEQRRAAREVATALTRRMGLSGKAAMLAAAYEMAALLGGALLLAAAAALPSAWLIVTRLDPLPRLPPPPVTVIPGAALAGIGAALLLACIAGAAALQRRAEAADVAEVLRVAE